MLLLLPQNPSKALCYVLSARNLSLGEVSDLAFRHTSYHSPHVRNKFRIRRRPFDREWNSSFPAGCSRNFRQTTHHAPVQISEHLESQVACRACKVYTSPQANVSHYASSQVQIDQPRMSSYIAAR